MTEQKLSLARIKKFGHTFELSIEPDAALRYKKGETNDLEEVLLAERIFTDAHKGLVAPSEKLIEAFKTTDFNKIADIILKHGEIQLTAEHRSQEREQQRKKLIDLIHRNAVDPKTGMPHPPNRIEAALEQGKIIVDAHKTVEEQFEGIVNKLRPIIPISVEKKKLQLIVPAQYAGKLYALVKNNSTILKEDWMNDGSWKARVEIPAGTVPDFIDKINSVAHGDVVVEIEK